MRLWLGTLTIYAGLSALFLLEPELVARIPISEGAAPYAAALLGPPVILVYGAEACGWFGIGTSLFLGLLGIAHFLWYSRPYSEAFAIALAAAALVWLFFGWSAWLVSV
jgi:hypothetical protein